MAELTDAELRERYAIQQGQGIKNVVPITEGTANSAYKVLRENLELLNKDIREIVRTPIHDTNRDSFSKKTRTELEFLIKTGASNQFLEKNYYFGIVIDGQNKPENQSLYDIYVDVPGKNPLIIEHPDDIVKPEFDRSKIEPLKFSPVEADFTGKLTPVKGGIALVKCAPSFPAHLVGDESGNIFLGMLR